MKQEINIKVAQEIPDHNYALFGQEVNGSTWALARMNMFLHGEDGARIDWSDTLNSPTLTDNTTNLQKFDVVVANPPFSLDKWGQKTLKMTFLTVFGVTFPQKLR